MFARRKNQPDAAFGAGGPVVVGNDAVAEAGTSIFTISVLVRSFGVPPERGAIEITPYVPLLTNEGLIVLVEWTTFGQE